MNKPFNPAVEIQDVLVFGEFGDVNPSICDSSTYTFLDSRTMEGVFQGEVEGCFLYTRHSNPTSNYLAAALARMEGGEAAHVMASGMAAITNVLMQICSSGDEIVASRTIYGGTYAFMANVLPRFGVTTHFVDTTNPEVVRAAINERTRLLYCESVSNPLLEVADIPMLSAIAREKNLKVVVDNTFSPLIISPLRLGADIVVHSMTKFINGTSDCVAGCVVSSEEFIHELMDINHGLSMLTGPVLDSIRSAGLFKNLHSLHIRMLKHGENAMTLAHRFQEAGIPVHYPGLPSHPHHALLNQIMNPGFGYGGIVTVDLGEHDRARHLMVRMQEAGVGYLAVSLGYFKTLFSAPGHSTSSEIPIEERLRSGTSDGLVRFSVGLDHDMNRTWSTIEGILAELG